MRIGVKPEDTRKYRIGQTNYTRIRSGNIQQTRDYTLCRLARQCPDYDSNSSICLDTPDLCAQAQVQELIRQGGGFS